MSLADDANAKLNEAKETAKDVAEKVSEKADITKQRIEGEVDKAKGDTLKGEIKVKTSQLRDELNK